MRSEFIALGLFIFWFIYEIVKSKLEDKRRCIAFGAKVSGFLASLAFTGVLPEYFAEQTNRFAQEEVTRCFSLRQSSPDDTLWDAAHVYDNFVEFAMLCIEVCLDTCEIPDLRGEEVSEAVSEFCRSNKMRAQRFDIHIPRKW